MMLAFTVASYAQQLTLTVDLCDANPAEVRMTGPWWGWDPMGGPIAADNGDGTWTITLDTPAENMEYLWVSDAVQENIIGLGCAPITDGANYANRLWEVGSGNVTADVYNSCDPCGTVIETASVTFNVDMSAEDVAESGVYVAGGDYFGTPGAYPMTDDDGDGIYTIAIDLPVPFTGNYIFTNGACGDFSCKENIAGQECADGTWNDRLLSDINEDTSVTFCFGQCSESCAATGLAMVTWNLNMENEDVSPDGVFLAGGIDFGAPGDNPMTDDDGDGVYSITLEVTTPYNGNYTFTNGACGDYSCKEDIAGQDCADGTWNDRLLSNITEDHVVNTCFGECSTDGSCSEPAQTAIVTFNVDMSEYTGDFGMVNLSGSLNGWCGDCNQMSDDDGDGVYTTTAELDLGTNIEYKFTLDNWAQQENFAGGESCTVTNNGNTNRALFVEGDQTLNAVCYNSCDACASADQTVSVTFQVDMSDHEGTFGMVISMEVSMAGAADVLL